MTAVNTYGQRVVIPVTNKSGGALALGDVVIVDTANNDAVTTTTAASSTQIVGVAQETIASNAVGRVCFGGYISLVNVNASVTRGHYGATFTVAKQATDAGASRGIGTFCEFLTGGTTPDAIIFNTDLLGSSLTNPMTTKGDIIQADTGGTPTRLAAGTSGYVLTAGGAGAFSAWAAAPGGILQSGQTILASDFTHTGDTTKTAITGLSLTLTTGAHRCLVFVSLPVLFTGSANNQICRFTHQVDGADDPSAYLGLIGNEVGNNVSPFTTVSFSLLTAVLSAASHTFSVALTNNASAASTTVYASLGKANILVVETGLTT